MYIASKNLKEVHDDDRVFFENFLQRSDQKQVLKNAMEIFPDKTYLGNYNMQKVITQYKKSPDGIELSKVHNSIPTIAVEHLDIAYKNFWKRLKTKPDGAGFPKYKSRFGNKSFGVKNLVKKPLIRNGDYVSSLVLTKKLGPIKCASSRHFPSGRILSATISQAPNGHYYASVLFEQAERYEHTFFSNPKYPIGIDLNISKDGQIVTSDNDAYTLPVDRFIEMDKRIASWSKKLARRKIRYDKRYEVEKRQYLNDHPTATAAEYPRKEYDSVRGIREARKALANAHEDQANLRKYWIEFITTELTRKHDFIALEKLQVKNMMKNHNLAHALASVSFAAFRTAFESKQQKYHCQVVTINPAYTSQTCHDCGHVMGNDGTKKLELNEREWDCPKCGVHHNRDVNAAKNILARGLEKREQELNKAS